ncbi:hypothetical protein [Acinetobacter baumannii]|uniref:hypothetical protein n=1 Tax=Acinetobacter baumannii TaxID=470 RepID=UPI0019D14905|nr:hypothetical protein [Acinetobacter baumannii]
MLIKISDTVVIDSKSVVKVLQHDVDGPLNPTAWFVYTSDNCKYRLREYSIEEFLNILNNPN